jgi:type IV secretion system protein VirB9
MQNMKIILSLLFIMLLPFEVMAKAQEPVPNPGDRRIRTYTYNPHQVFKFTGHYGFQSIIEFEEKEEIDSIIVGDSLSWQMVPSGRRLFLKPIEPDATTNMTIITTLRTYLFELHAEDADGIDDADLVFIARFNQPKVQKSTHNLIYDETDIELKDPRTLNRSYTMNGPDVIAPLSVFDDGEFTYFEFKDVNAEIPAIFMVDNNGFEELINYRMQGRYVVVERVTAQYSLRRGENVVCVFNEKMPRVKAEKD